MRHANAKFAAAQITITVMTLIYGSAILCEPAWATPYSSLVLSKSPVAYWRLGEASGPTAVEEVGTGGGANDGTYTNVAGGDFAQPGLITSDPDTAVRFDGSTSYVNAGNDASLQGAWPGITVMAWINADSLPGSGLADIVSQWVNSAAQDRFILSIDSSGRMLVSAADGISGINGAFGTATLAPGQRHFLAFTFQNGTPGTYNLYFDGLPDAISNTPTSLNNLNASTTADLHIGAQVTGSTRYFDGIIDEVAVFDSVLNATDIQAFYELGLNGPAVPEPSSLILLGLSIVGLACRTRRRRRRV